KKKGGGTYVNKPNHENYLSVFTPTLLHNTDYLELLEIRRALDSLAVQLCAKNITETGIRKLSQIVDDMEHLDDVHDFFTLDKKFHLLISKYSKNRFLHNIHLIIWDVIQKWKNGCSPGNRTAWTSGLESMGRKPDTLRTVWRSRDGWPFVRGRMQKPFHCMKKHWIF
ncbi:MAG: FCD domain-containing protein, partial [Desulfotignum sp.]